MLRPSSTPQKWTVASPIWLLFELRLRCVVQASLELLWSTILFSQPLEMWELQCTHDWVSSGLNYKTLWTQHRIFRKPLQKYLKHKLALPATVLYLAIRMVKEHCYTSCWWSSYNSFLVKKLNRKFLHIIIDLEILMRKKSITSTWLIANPIRI